MVCGLVRRTGGNDDDGEEEDDDGDDEDDDDDDDGGGGDDDEDDDCETDIGMCCTEREVIGPDLRRIASREGREENIDFVRRIRISTSASFTPLAADEERFARLVEDDVEAI